MKAYINVKDEVWCFITGLQPNHTEYLWKEFGIFVEGYFFMPAYKMGRYDGKIRFFEKTGKTYIRILDKILPYLEKWGYEIELVDNRHQVKHPTIRASKDLFGDIELNGKPVFLRPYQIECVNTCIDNAGGFILAATGAGKSLMTAALSHIYSSSGYKTITVVPSADLVTQTAEWYILMGMDTGIYSGSEKDLDHPNIVATWQSIQYNPSLLLDFQCLIWDEAHGIKGAMAAKLLNNDGKHIPFKFGVTGTFPKHEADKMSLHAAVGPILKEIPASWLIENGYLSKVEIQPIELNEVYIDEDFPDYAAEKSFLAKSPARMEMIADLIISQCATRGNTLVLVNSIPFGEKLAKLIKGAVFLYGESSKDIRREHYDMFEEKDDIIVIASVGIASTGLSIDRIFCLMFIDAGKSFIRAIQSVGRGLRKGRDKDSVYVVDVHSKQKWAKKHHKERLKWYAEANYPVLKKQTLIVKDK